MTKPVSDFDSAEFAEIIQRFFPIRSRIQFILPEEMRRARDRLEATRPGGKNNRSVDYALLHEVARVLTAKQEPISMGELSRALDVPLSSATRIVDWLEESGYVERQPDVLDRRVVRVALTAEARAIYQAAEEMARQRIEGWLERFSPDERRSLIMLLDKLVKIISEEIGAS
jgi:MarR family transcriptional regulator for hemolysin